MCEEYNLKLYAGCGFNIFNSIDINTLNCYKFIENFAISKELSFNEIKDLSYNFTVLNSSKLQIMDLIYCPFNKTCNDCKYQNNCYLQDDNNRIFPVIRYKLNTCRFKVYNMANLYCKDLDCYNTIYDLQNTDLNVLTEFFRCNNNYERANILSNLTIGNYKKGIK